MQLKAQQKSNVNVTKVSLRSLRPRLVANAMQAAHTFCQLFERTCLARREPLQRGLAYAPGRYPCKHSRNWSGVRNMKRFDHDTRLCAPDVNDVRTRNGVTSGEVQASMRQDTLRNLHNLKHECMVHLKHRLPAWPHIHTIGRTSSGSRSSLNRSRSGVVAVCVPFVSSRVRSPPCVLSAGMSRSAA